MKSCLTYTGETIQVFEIAEVEVEHNEQSLMLPLIVIPGAEPPLLGRDWLSTLRLDWKKVFQAHTRQSLQDVLDA